MFNSIISTRHEQTQLDQVVFNWPLQKTQSYSELSIVAAFNMFHLNIMILFSRVVFVHTESIYMLLR